MENEDQTLESGTGEDVESLELEPTAPKGDEAGLGDDPLDDIQDEKARADAKKWRAIARRQEKKPEQKPAEPVAPQSSEFLTKADFFKSNESKAIREATADPEVKASWNEIIPFYTPRRGKATPEDIREDINDAITLYNARNKTTIKDDSVDQLKTTPVVKGGGGTEVVSKDKAPELPNFRLPASPRDWYPKKS